MALAGTRPVQNRQIRRSWILEVGYDRLFRSALDALKVVESLKEWALSSTFWT